MTPAHCSPREPETLRSYLAFAVRAYGLFAIGTAALAGVAWWLIAGGGGR